METKTLNQEVEFKVKPHEVYEAFMDEKKHAEFTGSEATVSREVGGKFNIYGSITGENLELEQDKKIVQTWRYEDWPEGHYSKITLVLEETDNGTKVTFTHEDIPEDKYEDIKKGWNDYYWNPMKEMFE
ncbi:ATPase [archaeon]|nr:ATPase [archaeon]|tara:strand:+ start:5514 stop:5900 length:387 start_codon:yes stop_codon:yes gene_type:complete